MVRAGITLNGRTDLHVFEKGIVNAVRYRDEVWAPYFHLFTSAVRHEFILMDDNVRPIEFIWSKSFLESEDIHRMDWPIRSPDIIRVEHARNALGRAIQLANFQEPPKA
ncbi:transposable element Tcb2 transposase [Trichonephila clavipes]|nr:transposable element Tcb2 transposase [Trichonephila clavipes]